MNAVHQLCCFLADLLNSSLTWLFHGCMSWLDHVPWLSLGGGMKSYFPSTAHHLLLFFVLSPFLIFFFLVWLKALSLGSIIRLLVVWYSAVFLIVPLFFLQIRIGLFVFCAPPATAKFQSVALFPLKDAQLWFCVTYKFCSFLICGLYGCMLIPFWVAVLFLPPRMHMMGKWMRCSSALAPGY